MNKYGHIIKFERIRQNLKQVQLSEEICTPSYLSKIESNSIVPSEEILLELFNSLDIFQTNSKFTEEEFLEHVRSIYNEAIKFKDKARVSKYLDEIFEEKYLFANPSNFYSYILMLSRLKMMVHNQQNDTILFQKSISKFSNEFNPFQSVLYFTCNGYLHFYNNDFRSSLNSLNQALQCHAQCNLRECESADLYYFLGLVNLQLDNIIVALDFLTKSQSYFHKELLLFRSVETYIASAVAYKRAQNYDKYLEYLKLAEKIAIDENMLENLALIYFNYATYYALEGNFKKSLVFYHKTLEFTADIFVQLKTIYCIVLYNSMLFNFNEVLFWCEKGLGIYHSDPNETSKEFVFHFQVYLSIHTGYENFEKILMQTIDYFVKSDDFRHANKYALLIANYFNAAGKYKKATNYYKLATIYLAKKENRRFTEEI